MKFQPRDILRQEFFLFAATKQGGGSPSKEANEDGYWYNLCSMWSAIKV